MAISFGSDPATIVVRLAQDADFVQYVRIPALGADGLATAPWSPTDPIELRWIQKVGAPIIWTAAIDGTDTRLMGWNVDKAVVNPMLVLVRAKSIVAVRWFVGDTYQGRGTVKDVT